MKIHEVELEKHYDELITILSQKIFHCNQEQAEDIVNKFVEQYPEILTKYDLHLLYKL